YLADCQERGVTPDKTASGKLMLRIDPDVHARVSVAAAVSGESVNQWSEEALSRAASEVMERAAAAPKAKRAKPAAKRPRAASVTPVRKPASTPTRKPVARKAPARAPAHA
ncbi:MAG TPA: type II toxin-antitoxin system HicB family antitoxin, partial [Paraburkholderia sp.]